MKAAVLGCGAIGGLILGYLSEKKVDIAGVVKDYQKEPFIREGLKIEGVRGSLVCRVKVDTELRENVDLAIIASKINDIDKIVAENIKFLEKAVVLTIQNGVKADYILEKYFPRESIITGIVMFGATFYPPNKVFHNFEGGIAIGSIFNAETVNIAKVKGLLSKAFDITVMDNIKGAKYLKVFVNLNNCIPAIMGVSIQRAFSNLEIAELAIKLNREAYRVVEGNGIKLESLPGYPKERLEGILSMGIEEGASLFSKIMVSLSSEPLYGSILQSIKRGRKSEIDYINGEIVNLARKGGFEAPLNEKIVELVHKVEDTGKFLSEEQLLGEVS